MEAGADGIAVVSAIFSAPDPEAAAHELRKIVDRWRSRR
jgi:thiamine monophosphate synthase